MSLKQFSTSSPALPGSSFPAGKSRQPVTALVPIPTLVLFLMAITLLNQTTCRTHRHCRLQPDGCGTDRRSVQIIHSMSYEENYQHMIRRNKATGYAIYDCLLKAYRKHAESMDVSGITDRDISRISEMLLVSERWIRHILCKYHLFFVIIDQYYPEEDWKDEETEV